MRCVASRNAPSKPGDVPRPPRRPCRIRGAASRRQWRRCWCGRGRGNGVLDAGRYTNGKELVAALGVDRSSVTDAQAHTPLAQDRPLHCRGGACHRRSPRCGSAKKAPPTGTSRSASSSGNSKRDNRTQAVGHRCPAAFFASGAHFNLMAREVTFILCCNNGPVYVLQFKVTL